MEMIPSRVNSRASAAEKKIFEALSKVQVPGWTYALHSINLPEHERKRVCEIDFVLIGERGILGLEAKGGGISRINGVWHSQSMSGRKHRLSESPLEQARSGVFSLEGRLGKAKKIERKTVARTVFGHGVVFPDCDFDVESVEWTPELILDRRRLEFEGWDVCLDKLGKFWEDKPGHRSALTADDVQRYLDLLRADFDRVPTLRQHGRNVDAELVALTEQQYRALDNCRHNPRILYEGGAGTGKTMLAAEMCRRENTSSKVLLTCRSGVLANFLRIQAGMENTSVMPFSRMSEVADDSVDLIVIDEAQDVINTTDLATVDRVLRGGLSEGRWVFLLDSNNQRGLVGSYEDAAMEALRQQRPVRFTLTDNCRNTVEIVRATQDRTGADLGVTTAGPGREVVFTEAPRAEAIATAAKVLESLEDHEVPMDQVVLLSTHELSSSLFASLPDIWRRRIDVLDLKRLSRPGPGRIGFATTGDFKGLERRYVLLEASDHSQATRAKASLYVGMTRAKAALWVISPVDVRIEKALK
ncbi:nuclease-related domain-containing DEAD/DEAH box helicase [Lentzea albida]|uniref:AAA domain-containing protein n=1 Tax=Lentzea albida TaxID=65499 RepID=A0A1H9BRI2_9PSEU|nr:NERD domain-containing protein [Lentzea albida]SEP91311.1 AAA domain-containing protein [Lentzea albida]